MDNLDNLENIDAAEEKDAKEEEALAKELAEQVSAEMTEDEKQSLDVFSDGSKTDDIKFDDSIDVDKLQEVLQNKIDNEGNDEEIDIGFQIAPGFQKSEAKDMPLPASESEISAKKYVVYINPENIDYMENLSNIERREIVNKILNDKKTFDKKSNEMERTRKYTIKVIIVVLTVIIGFPLMFTIVNKGLQITMDNYQQAKDNFTKLYKTKGKIKQTNQNEEMKY